MKVVKPKCKQCRPGPGMTYLGAHLDARERLKRGERQKQCLTCGLWRWPHQLVEARTSQGKK